MIFTALAESVEPDKGTDGDDDDGVRNENPIENNETDGNVISLNGCSNG